MHPWSCKCTCMPSSICCILSYKQTIYTILTMTSKSPILLFSRNLHSIYFLQLPFLILLITCIVQSLNSSCSVRTIYLSSRETVRFVGNETLMRYTVEFSEAELLSYLGVSTELNYHFTITFKGCFLLVINCDTGKVINNTMIEISECYPIPLPVTLILREISAQSCSRSPNSHINTSVQCLGE